MWREGRYRWGSRPQPLGGPFAGVYAAVGSYDIRLFPRGPEPLGVLSRWGYSVGLTAGYSHPLSRRLSLEFSLGAGYLGGRYDKYNHSLYTDRYIRRSSHRRTYVGPTKAAVSLVWLIGTQNRPAARRAGKRAEHGKTNDGGAPLPYARAKRQLKR